MLFWLGCATSRPTPGGRVLAIPRKPVKLPGGWSYWPQRKKEPRPLRIHHLRLNLAAANLEIAVAVTPDADGKGPGEARLDMPLAIARRHRFVAAVNANAFGPIPDADGKKPKGWRDGQPVEIMGLAAAAEKVRSPAQRGYIAFWLDAAGQPRLGNPGPNDAVQLGCAGFGWLVRDGAVAGRDDSQHPRTALGLDRDGKALWLVVVDGRQEGYSEGMSTRELADYMQELGCWNAVNLDGGGSSIMIVTDSEGRRVVANRPSKRTADVSLHRPVPVLIGFRQR